jgi:inosine-uridine nucleoside N-ribohydrolase
VSRNVLLDVDPGCDDAVMLAMGLGSSDLDVVGVTTVAGNATVEQTTHNALAVLAMAGRTDVPVAMGCDRPLVDSLTTAEWIHGEGGIRGELPSPAAEPVEASAPEFIVEQCREHGGDLTLVAVGPMTNVAVALAIEPSIPDLVDSLVLMGGAAMTAGNATPVAEANFHNDPEAASRVLQAGRPAMVGLDVTNSATVDPGYVDGLRELSPAGATVAEWFDYPEAVVQFTEDGRPAIHDAAVVADLLGDVLTFEPYYAEVDTSAGPSRGSVVCDQHGVTGNDPTVDVATDIDVPAFRSALERGVDGFLEACSA